MTPVVAGQATTTQPFRARWYRPTMLGLTLVILGFGLVVFVMRWQVFEARDLVGIDYRLFLNLGERWAGTGSMYLPYQFAGPYPFDQAAGTTDLDAMPGLYPPLAGPVFALLRFVPWPLWWIVPLGVIAWSLRRAPWWSWPLLAAVACLPQTASVVIVGGSTMWVAAGVAAGARFGWPALVVAFKPTLALFALVGVRHRAFWGGAAVLAVASLALLPEWGRYVEVVRNAESPGLAYSLGDWPLMLIPLVAWYDR